MEVRNDHQPCGEYSRCPNCGHDELAEYYDETLWCPECDWHAGTSCKEFFCPSCGSYEIRYEENRAVCKECGCTVILDCDGIVPRADHPGWYKILRAKKAELLPGFTGLSISFSEFTELEEVILPPGLEVIRYNAFFSCFALSRVRIPQSVRVIEGGAFFGCAFTEILLPEGIPEIGEFTFCGCGQLKRITIPESVTRIGTAAFQYCSSLEEILLPKSLEKIDSLAFNGCTALRHIVIPADTDVDPEAFRGCADIVIERA